MKQNQLSLHHGIQWELLQVNKKNDVSCLVDVVLHIRKALSEIFRKCFLCYSSLDSVLLLSELLSASFDDSVEELSSLEDSAVDDSFSEELELEP